MAPAPRSPYELTVGSALDDLHPVLRRYVSAVPEGQRGYGNGVFEVVGSPRRWLRPALRMLAAQNIVFPVWEKNVPFTVVNAPLVDRDGRTAVLAVRRFHLGSGPATMIDAITAENPGPDGLVDHLGTDRLLRVRLSARVVRGELHLQSTRLEVRLGSHFFKVPALLAPQVTVVDRYDDTADGGEGAQRVTVRVDAPVLGRLYEYTGTFHYELRPETRAAQNTEDATDARNLTDGPHA
ncbi:DUF4166 domain-containing protein [Herbiconiux sp. KACC 21604]|uniref:DUF4166 domain-containing protein n=1 Tax=unclassified Herbiconiux TaxID=2618217 RepID=UPI0014927E96|nr:DUF4166 domain-containing protein [Herbiconiux sp. SALV-R1]QJU53574.1 DUF4166 domain-containing protein [Herbiconiux sp. SALV-R1]WPO88555.1 DUF4166 domain-containing protein [Herbiconiux sp. KACC 21604]